jgi:hypothetical protein
VIVPKHASLRTTQRLRGGRGQLVIEIGFKESAKLHAGLAQTIETASQAAFIAHAAHDKMRMLGFGREKRTRGFEAGVTRLNDLLRRGQIAPDEDVHIRCWIYLQELHGNLR